MDIVMINTEDYLNCKPMSLENKFHQLVWHIIKLEHRIDELERQVEDIGGKV